MTTFTYNGTNLDSLGYLTIADDYLDMPTRRGGNVSVPFHHGSVFSQKFYNERVLTFGIAVAGTSLSDLETKLDAIRALFSNPTQKTLSIVFEDSSTKTVQVTIDKPLMIKRKLHLARVAVQMTMCEPFFRLSTVIADNTIPIEDPTDPMTVTNTGTAEERDPTIIIHGALTSMVITNTTNGAILTYTGTIGTGATVTIGTLNGEYYATLSTGSANVIGNVTHSGSQALMTFDVGDNVLSIDSVGYDANTTLKVSFYPPFL